MKTNISYFCSCCGIRCYFSKSNVSVSGSGSARILQQLTATQNLTLVVVSFGLSTTITGGMTISGGMGLSQTITTDAGQGVSGGQTLSSQLAAQQLLLVTLKLVTLQVLLAVL